MINLWWRVGSGKYRKICFHTQEGVTNWLNYAKQYPGFQVRYKEPRRV